MTVNELIKALSALPDHQKAWPVVAFDGSVTQDREEVTGIYDFLRTWGKYVEYMSVPVDGDFIMVSTR